MRKAFLGSLLIASLIASACWAEQPFGWSFVSSAPASYQVFRETSAPYQGKSSGGIRGAATARRGSYGLLAQKVSARHYRGHRVRLSARLRLSQVSGRAGLWIRADDDQGETLGFDNMEKTPLRGDLDWALVELDLDVPMSCTELHYGALLQGPGELTVDSLTLKVLGEVRPAARAASRLRGLPLQPINGDFER